MSWLQALLLGLVQGLTEFLPVSSSGHLMIVRELLGVDGEGFLDFTVTVHLATVLSTLVVLAVLSMINRNIESALWPVPMRLPSSSSEP